MLCHVGVRGRVKGERACDQRLGCGGLHSIENRAGLTGWRARQKPAGSASATEVAVDIKVRTFDGTRGPGDGLHDGVVGTVHPEGILSELATQDVVALCIRQLEEWCILGFVKVWRDVTETSIEKNTREKVTDYFQDRL